MNSLKYSKLLSKFSRPIIIRRIVGHSMVPGLPPGTLILAHKFNGRFHVRDVVVFSHEEKEKVKRVSEVRPDAVFVLGDHPETSTDSRHFGWIKNGQVMAKVFWPRSRK